MAFLHLKVMLPEKFNDPDAVILLQQDGIDVIDNVADEDGKGQYILFVITCIHAAGLEKNQTAEVITFKHLDFSKVIFNANAVTRLKVSVLRKPADKFDTQSPVNPLIFTYI